LGIPGFPVGVGPWQTQLPTLPGKCMASRSFHWWPGWGIFKRAAAHWMKGQHPLATLMLSCCRISVLIVGTCSAGAVLSERRKRYLPHCWPDGSLQLTAAHNCQPLSVVPRIQRDPACRIVLGWAEGASSPAGLRPPTFFGRCAQHAVTSWLSSTKVHARISNVPACLYSFLQYAPKKEYYKEEKHEEVRLLSACSQSA
jgi:hypothetical protein